MSSSVRVGILPAQTACGEQCDGNLRPLLPQSGDMPARPAIIPSAFRILTVSR
jgi:hypothetical protein